MVLRTERTFVSGRHHFIAHDSRKFCSREDARVSDRKHARGDPVHTAAGRDAESGGTGVSFDAALLSPYHVFARYGKGGASWGLRCVYIASLLVRVGFGHRSTSGCRNSRPNRTSKARV